MNGDISLSETLGGLRIANPDDSIESPSPPPESAYTRSLTAGPSPTSHSSSSTLTATQPRGQIPSHALDEPKSGPQSFEPDYTSAPVTPGGLALVQENSSYMTTPTSYGSNRLSHRQSMPLAHQAQQHQQQVQSPSYPPPTMNTTRGYVPAVARPISGIYNHPNVSGGSQSSNYSAYRYGDEPPQAVAPPHRSSSRSAHVSMQTPAMQLRDVPRTGEFMLAGNGLPPPRRSSRRISPATSVPTTPGVVPYGSSSYVEGGPLPSSEEWKEKGAAVSVKKEVDANGKTIHKFTKKGVKDFEFGRTLGEGSYSTVLAATDRTTLREYAIKVLDKRHIIREKKVKYVNIEKDTLNRLNDHPGIVRLYYTFQDEGSLYFVLDLASNGELLGTLKKMGTFDEECTRFYGAQILDAVEYMHSRGVLHRDLKPENVLLDSNMHIKITDFGTGKILDETPRTASNGNGVFPGTEEHRAVSFVGTAEYVSPELLTAKDGGKPTDLWAFGCIIYQLLTGRPPFKGATEYLTFDKILKLDYTFPPGFPSVARDLIERLLVPDPSKRLTINHVKNHRFFEGIIWGRGLWKQKAPRLKPYVPPPPEPIRLNVGPTTSTPSSMTLNPLNPTSQPRPHTTRIITELPPPSQLDIEWSPVLTRTNERILKLGNLVVTVMPQPHGSALKNGEPSSHEAPRKFSRFFMSSNTTKKRQRLVMVTSSARIVLAASGGDEKKAKMEISLVGQGTNWRCFKDSKGLTVWCVDTRDKHILFEHPPSPPPEPDGTAVIVSEWLGAIDRARELAITQQSYNGSYSGDSTFNDLSSQISSPTGSTLGGADFGGDGALDGVNIPSAVRLRKDEDTESLRKGRKRFSRRQSKGGLAAVF